MRNRTERTFAKRVRQDKAREISTLNQCSRSIRPSRSATYDEQNWREEVDKKGATVIISFFFLFFPLHVSRAVKKRSTQTGQ